MNRATPRHTLELSGDGLTLDDAEAILRGQVGQLTLAAAARKRVDQARRCLEKDRKRPGKEDAGPEKRMQLIQPFEMSCVLFSGPLFRLTKAGHDA